MIGLELFGQLKDVLGLYGLVFGDQKLCVGVAFCKGLDLVLLACSQICSFYSEQNLFLKLLVKVSLTL